MKLSKTILSISSAVLLSASVSAEKIVCEGSSTVGPIAKAFAEYFMDKNKEVSVTVSESGSGNGAKALVNNTCSVATMSRNIKDKEFAAAAENGVQACPHVVALDGIAVAVHKSNPVKNLTLVQLKDIYLGKISNWSQVGGANSKIIVITRDTNSGTFETFNKLVMKKEKVVDKAEVVGSNGQARSRITTTKNAIAYVGLGFLEGVKAVNINGVEATPDTIRSGAYAISRPLFMYTNGYPKIGTALYNFVTLHLSEDGQEMVEELGFVPVTNY